MARTDDRCPAAASSSNESGPDDDDNRDTEHRTDLADEDRAAQDRGGTATPLPAVATIIRAAQGWWNTRRAFAFVVNASTLHEHEGKGRRAHQREERILLLDWG